MSFILDALKKSESDRQRQNGPALFEVRVAPPRAGLPPWAIAIAALLVVNLGIVVWMLTRHAAPPAAGAPVAPAEAVSATNAAAPPPPPVTAAPAAAAPATAPAPVAQTAGPAPALARTATDQAATSSSVPAPEAAPASGPNADDYAPAAEPTADTGFGGQVRRGTGEGVPLYKQSAVAAQLPQLHLDLHAYAEKPADRWAMINMHKVHEGDSLPQGVHVEQITPDGVVLSFQGSQFLLTRE